VPKTIHFCFPAGSLVPDNLPGLAKSRDGQHKCIRLNPQSFYFILVTTGLAKTHGVSLLEVQKWFDGDCPGVRRRPLCEDCPLRPPDYVPPAHLLDASDSDSRANEPESPEGECSLDAAAGVKADLGEDIF
jgi:hypothetical protein